MASGKNIPSIFFRFWMQIAHFLAVPLFFVSYSLVYSPFDLLEYFDMGPMDVSFNLVMVACIALLVLVGTRLTFYFLKGRMRLNMEQYLLWCVAEILVIAAFMSLYLCLMNGSGQYFPVLGKCLKYSFGVMVYPYVILALIGYANAYKEVEVKPEDESLVRFKDPGGRLKLAVAASSVLYIEAEENYVHIHYVDGGRIKDYVLRSSMKNIEDTVSGYGILRCHRSFFVNPQHITLLRKDKEMGVLADFDVDGARSIPVSKSYYGAITEII